MSRTSILIKVLLAYFKKEADLALERQRKEVERRKKLENENKNSLQRTKDELIRLEKQLEDLRKVVQLHWGNFYLLLIQFCTHVLDKMNGFYNSFTKKILPSCIVCLLHSVFYTVKILSTMISNKVFLKP